ncbi:MAG TPA: flavodoxin family protein, partial [Spirochaetota bacterium]
MPESRKIIKPDTKIAAFFGSPRKNGFSSRLHEAVLSAAHDQVRRFYIHEMKILPCTGCGHCRSQISCIHNDDMNEIYDAVLSSSILSFSFPLYFSSIPGPLKTMIDRFQPFWEAARREEYPACGQTASVFITAGSRYKDMFLPSTTIIRHLMNSIHGTFSSERSIYCSNLDGEDGQA